MNKLLISATIAVCMSITALINAMAAELDVEYDNNSGSINYSCKSENNDVKFIISPDYISLENLTTEQVNSENGIIMFTASTDEKGDINSTIAFDNNFPNGKFLFYAIDEASCYTTVFARTDMTLLTSFLSKLNSSSKASWNDLITSECPIYSSSDRVSDIADMLADAKPSNGYTADNFIKYYCLAAGIAAFNENDISLEDFLMEYEEYTSVPFDEFVDQSKETKEELGNLMKQSSIKLNDFNDTYDELLFVSQFMCSEVYSNMKDTTVQYFNDNNISMTDYNTLSDYYKNRVFENLYSKRKILNTVSSIKNEFNIAVAEMAKESNKNNGLAGGGGGGGSSSPSSSMGNGNPMGSNPITNSTSQPELADISEHWAKNIIEDMFKKGNIAGYEDGTFRPDLSITRAEFVKIIVSAMKWSVQSGTQFTDVNNDAWYTGYIGAAYNKGLVTGNDENQFMPDKSITREDAAVIIYRASEVMGMDLEGEALTFDDYDDISDYASEAVKALSAVKIVQGNDGKFIPKSDITRAEATVLLSRLISIN